MDPKSGNIDYESGDSDGDNACSIIMKPQQQSLNTILFVDDDEDERTNNNYHHEDPNNFNSESYQNILRKIEVHNFIYMSCLFSLNHAGVVSALVLVLADSGTIGLYQNAIINITYTLSAILFAGSHVSKSMGPRRGMQLGKWLYSFFVICAMIQHAVRDSTHPNLSGIENSIAIIGAIIGGMGGGVLWTAQGSYFYAASSSYANAADVSFASATSYYANIFAAIFLVGEVLMKAMASVMTAWWHLSIVTVYSFYTIICVAAALGLNYVHDYDYCCSDDADDSAAAAAAAAHHAVGDENNEEEEEEEDDDSNTAVRRAARQRLSGSKALDAVRLLQTVCDDDSSCLFVCLFVCSVSIFESVFILERYSLLRTLHCTTFFSWDVYIRIQR